MAQGGTAAGRSGAILLIHGIGEQRPYEALDSFVQGLAGEWGIEDGKLEHRLTWRDGRADTAVRVPLGRRVDRAGAGCLDVHEYYWAAQFERRISLRKVLSWVARTSVTPLRSWATNAPLLGLESRSARSAFYREVRRAAFLIGVASLVVGLYIWVASQYEELRDVLGRVWGAIAAPLPPGPATRAGAAGVLEWLVRNEFPLILFAWIVICFMGVALLRSLSLLRSGPAGQAAMTAPAFQSWRKRTVAFALVLIVTSVVIACIPALGVRSALSQAARIVFCSWQVWVLVFAAAVAFVGRHFLVSYLGDVALYVDEDERSASFAAREKVLKGAVARLRALLRDGRYDSVYVAGHSLGSVIAYDAVDYLAREMRADPAPGDPGGRLTDREFQKLLGLLTFGSPLDKVVYFFRTQVRTKQAIRSQLLSSLHSFRKRSSRRDYGSLHFAVYNPPEPARLLWLNVHSPADPVSGPLDFFRPDHQVSMGYPRTPRAHMLYWDDPRFYSWVAWWLCAPHREGLTAGPPPAAPPAHGPHRP